jgi:hypothetical protein
MACAVCPIHLVPSVMMLHKAFFLCHPVQELSAFGATYACQIHQHSSLDFLDDLTCYVDRSVSHPILSYTRNPGISVLPGYYSCQELR